VNLDTIPYLAKSKLPATNNETAGNVCGSENRNNDLRASNFVADSFARRLSTYNESFLYFEARKVTAW
jgi:hypothetical protein